MYTVCRKDDEQDEVGDQQEEIEGVRLVEPFESLVSLLTDEFAETTALLRENQNACEL